nr:MAG TPA: hypothetical protein [Caudoviricetes sp.]
MVLSFSLLLNHPSHPLPKDKISNSKGERHNDRNTRNRIQSNQRP